MRCDMDQMRCILLLFMHFFRRKVWSINAFVALNQQERKTLTSVLYDVCNITIKYETIRSTIARDQPFHTQEIQSASTKEVRGKYFLWE